MIHVRRRRCAGDAGMRDSDGDGDDAAMTVVMRGCVTVIVTSVICAEMMCGDADPSCGRRSARLFRTSSGPRAAFVSQCLKCAMLLLLMILLLMILLLPAYLRICPYQALERNTALCWVFLGADSESTVDPARISLLTDLLERCDMTLSKAFRVAHPSRSSEALLSVLRPIRWPCSAEGSCRRQRSIRVIHPSHPSEPTIRVTHVSHPPRHEAESNPIRDRDRRLGWVTCIDDSDG